MRSDLGRSRSLMAAHPNFTAESDDHHVRLTAVSRKGIYRPDRDPRVWSGSWFLWAGDRDWAEPQTQSKEEEK